MTELSGVEFVTRVKSTRALITLCRHELGNLPASDQAIISQPLKEAIGMFDYAATMGSRNTLNGYADEIVEWLTTILDLKEQVDAE